MKFLAVLCVRNEAAFLLDWLAHHRAVGFDHVLVYSNDCDDGTDAMLDRLAEMGHVTHIRNDGPYAKGGIQFTALKRAGTLDVVRQAEWLLPLDVDEFVNIHVGDHTLAALLNALPQATAITLTWRLFGNAGQVRYQDAPVTRTFTRCAPAVMYWPWRASMFKTLYRNDGTYGQMGVHRPRKPDDARLKDAKWFDGEGRTLDRQFKRRRIFSNFGQSNTALVQLNHYPLGAMESYVLKADRGRAVHSDDLLGLDYWVERNFNTDEDTSVQSLAPAADAIAQELKSDPELARLHAAAVAWRHARFDALMRHEPYRALFGRLLMAAPSRPVPRKAAHFMAAHATAARDGPRDS
ncbi:glycosyltransferase family 2 protein [Sulfitobacter sabulilitoris]|uniref:Glycosyltransferase family 2 protein n=1 Tax=Sulfitobacter sabulilitoris TaxID=2562655 RepID=A0A5S3PQS2_9RHOB|nr:glycosyltransferase family 2 protein [Sulfitobacter sabulilitoris]TMM54895.1 glycosyltransferase family 2 protein [Sulfitobacter sabulilitoris]